MKKYKTLFKESTEKVPYKVYGNANLQEFLDYFLKLYNKRYKTKFTTKEVNIEFKEKELNYPIYQIFVGKVEKYFNIIIQDKKTYNNLYEGFLLVLVDYKGKKINSYVSWEVKEKSPQGQIENVTFVFE